MSKGKSPDLFFDKIKPRLKSPGNSNLALRNLGSQPNISKLYLNSQAGRINSVSHLRSSKLIKRKKSFTKLKSPLNKSPSSPLEIRDTKDDITSSFSITKDYEDISQIEKMLKKIEALNKKISESQSKASEKLLFEEKINLHKKLFDEIIEKDKNFGKFLLLIKNSYEDYYETKINKLTSQYQIEITELKGIIHKNNENSAALERSLDKLSKENLDLSKELEHNEKVCERLSKKLSMIASYDVKNIPLNEET